MILVTAGYDHSIKFWDVNTGMSTTNISYPDSHINKLAITNDRKYLGVAAHQVVKVYEISLSPNVAPSSEVSFEGHQGNITALGFQKDNKWFFTASEDGTLKIFDFKTSGYMRNFDNNSVMVNCAVLHPNQGEIFFGDQSGRVRIWDLTENNCKELYVDSKEEPFRSIAISQSAKKLVAGNNIGMCFIWEQNGSEYVPMQILDAHPGHYILKCQFSHDDQYLATASSDRTCVVWKLEVTEEVNPETTDAGVDHDV